MKYKLLIILSFIFIISCGDDGSKEQSSNEITPNPSISDTQIDSTVYDPYNLEQFKGIWIFSYVVAGITFSNTYTFGTIINDTLIGNDKYNETVALKYDNNLDYWTLLDTASLFDRFYTFEFNGIDRISGCYYQIDNNGENEEDYSKCYKLKGLKIDIVLTKKIDKINDENNEPIMEKVFSDSYMQIAINNLKLAGDKND